MAQTTSRNPVSQEPLHMTLRDYLQKTEDALGSRRIDDALAYCQTILTRFPDALEGLRLLGEVYMAQGHMEEARQSFDWVLINDPENVVAYCSRALVSERIGDVDTALDCYQQAYELSRGNSQIRQVFNQLSKKSGQPGFMLSRAGLARLYTRGSLYFQAQQEWDIVLAQTPDRLDARIGLLQLYWLQGRSDLVVQLARQILKTVPDCLKALLLLAYTLAPQDMGQAQELMRHADALDPDQMMAHDLFTDVLARQPNHPFVQLLHSDPVSLSDVQFTAAQSSAPVTEDQPFMGRPASSANDIFSQLGEASNQSDMTVVGRSVGQSPAGQNGVEQNVPGNGANSVGAGQLFSQADTSFDTGVRSNDRVTPTTWDASETAGAPEPEPWDLLQKTLDGIDTKGTDQQPEASAPSPAVWNDASAASSTEASQAGSAQGIGDLNSPSLWGVTPEESTPPDWLNMLTQMERGQLDDAAHETNVGGSSQAQSTPLPPAEPVAGPVEEVSAQPQVVQEPPQRQNDTPMTYLDDDDDDIGLPTHDTLPAWMKTEGPVIQQEPLVSRSGALPETMAEGDEGDEEELMFGPDWLKSLGAASLNGLSAEMPAIDLPAATESTGPQSQSQSEQRGQFAPAQEEGTQASNPVDVTRSMSPEESWAAFIQNDSAAERNTPGDAGSDESEQSGVYTPSDAEQPAWLAQIAAFQSGNGGTDEPLRTTSAEQSSSPDGKPQEQDIEAVLQQLEQRYSSGFVPLEPNSLSSIAQAENSLFNAPAEETVPTSDNEDASLSSALAELGRYSPPADETADSNQGQDPYFADPTTPMDEPLWLAALRSSSVPQMPTFAEEAGQNTAPAEQAEDGFKQVESGANEGREPFSPPMETPVADVSSPVDAGAERAKMPNETFSFDPVTPAPASAADALSSARPNPLLENELETTMRRPAVRLQPVQQKSGFIQESNRTSEVGLGGNGNYREHLLNGYQAQLMGDFDGAMREYRMIIRNAPDLLGDVVSNVRALLKIAPNYSAGYRVLGDAYMRQGEYLQAMESYNKALTMVKKAKN